MGRRRIEIKKIECPKALNVCFSKRRQGVFKKARELSVLCGVDILAIVFSPTGKPFTFTSSSSSSSSQCTPESLINRYLQYTSSVKPLYSSSSSVAVNESVEKSRISGHDVHEQEEETRVPFSQIPDTLSLYESYLYQDLRYQKQAVANRSQEIVTGKARDSELPIDDHNGLSEFETFNSFSSSIHEERDWGFPEAARDSSVLDSRSTVVGDDKIANPIALKSNDSLFCPFEQSDAGLGFGFGFDFDFECGAEWNNWNFASSDGAESNNDKH